MRNLDDGLDVEVTADLVAAPRQFAGNVGERSNVEGAHQEMDATVRDLVTSFDHSMGAETALLRGIAMCGHVAAQ